MNHFNSTSLQSPVLPCTIVLHAVVCYGLTVLEAQATVMPLHVSRTMTALEHTGSEKCMGQELGLCVFFCHSCILFPREVEAGESTMK